MDIRNKLEYRAKELGFDMLGFVDLGAEESLDASIADWAGGADRIDPIDEAQRLMEGGRTVIIAVRAHKPISYNLDRVVGRISSHYIEYPKGYKNIKVLGDLLIEEDYRAIVNPNLPLKELAFRAGLGYYGKNGLIHNDEFGSFMSFHPILTDAKIEVSCMRDKISDCGDCKLCVLACPTDAIDLNGSINIDRCLRSHMLTSEIIELEFREKLSNSILGCDICQRVCPFNRESFKDARVQDEKVSELLDIKMILKEGNLSLKERILELEDIIGKNYARPQRLLSSAIIVAGNSGDTSLIDLLRSYDEHQSPSVREHSRWAIEKLKTCK